MGNGYIGFRFGKGSYHKFKTNQPWEEVKAFQHTHDVTKEGCYECHEIPYTPGMPRVAELDIGKTELSMIRDCYHQAVRKLKVEPWCPWVWHFDEQEAWVSPKAADTLSQLWKDIWRTVQDLMKESYPVSDTYLTQFIKDAQEMLDYATVHGLWIRIVHHNGY
jgi:hypothetical protein